MTAQAQGRDGHSERGTGPPAGAGGRGRAAAERVLIAAKTGVRAKVAEAGGIDAVHSTPRMGSPGSPPRSRRCARCTAGRAVAGGGRFGEFEQLLLAAGFAEYLSQIAGGIPMSQAEIVRPSAMGVPLADVRRFEDAVAELVAEGSAEAVKARLAALIAEHATFGDSGLDETHAQIHEQMRRFSEAEVVPHARVAPRQRLHPDGDRREGGRAGVFGLTLPEAYGGLGLGKESMCIVSEELSRGYIGVGSLGTRSEIAGELILNNGTEEQKETYLPRLASGDCCRRRCSRSPTSAPTWPRSRRARSRRATSTR